MEKKEKAGSAKRAALKVIAEQFKGNATECQRERLRAALQQWRRLSTIEIRRDLDILHPAGRARDLRLQGVNIQTVWTTEETQSGKPHRVGVYLLMAEGGHA
jgi:hypothetical protein